jgi:excisionase family DNA binding protein
MLKPTGKVILLLKIEVDEQSVREMIEKAIHIKVEELVRDKYFFTYNELSKYLNMSKPSIEKSLIKNGLKYYKMGSKYLFKKDEVDYFLDQVTESMTATNNDFNLFQIDYK